MSGLIEALIGPLGGVLAGLGTAMVVLWRLWRKALARAAEAERKAKTQKEMREIESDVRLYEDEELAARLTRRDMQRR